MRCPYSRTLFFMATGGARFNRKTGPTLEQRQRAAKRERKREKKVLGKRVKIAKTRRTGTGKVGAPTKKRAKKVRVRESKT